MNQKILLEDFFFQMLDFYQNDNIIADFELINTEDATTIYPTHNHSNSKAYLLLYLRSKFCN